jgi:hypothetical protein
MLAPALREQVARGEPGLARADDDRVHLRQSLGHVQRF